jgi:hypothetical protein
MLFTNLGRIVVFLALVIGVWYVAGGLMIGTGALAPEQAALAHFFPRAIFQGS